MDDRRDGTLVGLASLGIALGGVALGAYLNTRDDRRKKHPDDSPGYTMKQGTGAYDVTGRTVTIDKPKAELFAFFRDFQNLPQFMENLEAVVPTGQPGRNTWKIKAPLGRTVDVETEIVHEEEGELIAWRFGGGIRHRHGRAESNSSDAPGDRGTQVQLIVAYKPPAG